MCWPWPVRRAIIPRVLVFGLVLSIALMGLAASFIARLLQKHRWIAYVGLAIILYVALDMIYRGSSTSRRTTPRRSPSTCNRC
jgi:predicted tellurium resistance membrane protein TerC